MADIIEAIVRGLFMLMVATLGPFVMYGIINPEFIPVMGEFIYNMFF